MKCDGPEDCSGNQSCCATFIGNQVDSMTCIHTSQCDTDKTVCGGTGSCAGGLTCKPLAAHPAYKLCQP